MMQRFVDRFPGPVNVNGSRPHYSHPNRATLAKVTDCPCSDGVRRTVYVQGEPVSANAIPASVSYQGKPAEGYLAAIGGGMVFQFLMATVYEREIPVCDLDPETGNPTTWRRFAVSYGNGNDGLSRLYPAFTLDCHPDALYDVARLAVTTSGRASRAYLAKAVQVDEAGEDAVQACVSNPPRAGHEWSDANGAWILCDVYPASEVSDSWEGSHHVSPVAAFGKAAATLR